MLGNTNILIIFLVTMITMVSCGTKQEVVEAPKPIQGGEYVPEHSEYVFLVMYDAEDLTDPVKPRLEVR